jgi:hypothetical protein
MDIARWWRSMHTNAAVAPHAGAHLETPGEEITINIAQECQVALPSANRVPEVSVTLTSNRPGVAAHGSYQGPTMIIGQGQFTATNSDVHAGFVVLPSGWPVLGVGAEATWEDGAPHSVALTYVQLACDPWVWWRWLIPALKILTRPSS